MEMIPELWIYIIIGIIMLCLINILKTDSISVVQKVISYSVLITLSFVVGIGFHFVVDDKKIKEKRNKLYNKLKKELKKE